VEAAGNKSWPKHTNTQTLKHRKDRKTRLLAACHLYHIHKSTHTRMARVQQAAGWSLVPKSEGQFGTNLGDSADRQVGYCNAIPLRVTLREHGTKGINDSRAPMKGRGVGGVEGDVWSDNITLAIEGGASEQQVPVVFACQVEEGAGRTDTVHRCLDARAITRQKNGES